MREFKNVSFLYEGNLALALAPALTPTGVENEPYFFSGEIVHPKVVSGALLVLAEIVSTRYFNYSPTALRDPILSAQGDRLRAECFSACNGVYARLDLFREGLCGDIAYGTTNVDIGTQLQKLLIRIKQDDKLRLNIGSDGLSAFHGQRQSDGANITQFVRQRPVEMPDRWIRALGNCAPIHQDMQERFRVEGMAAKVFLSSLPPATGKERGGWLTYTKTGIRLEQRAGTDSVYISGIHRLSALRRMMGDVHSLVFYAPQNREKGEMMIQVGLPDAQLTLSLTAKSCQGYSGEGSLLEALSTPETIENSDRLASMLKFESKIDKARIAEALGLSKSETDHAMGLLAVSGKLGYDANERAYFHRELPEEPERMWKDNPRLKSAKELCKVTTRLDKASWLVHSKDACYRVFYDREEGMQNAKCTCTWYLRHQNGRGPCKHILAAKLIAEEENNGE